jgi:hypothetical protein
MEGYLLNLTLEKFSERPTNAQGSSGCFINTFQISIPTCLGIYLPSSGGRECLISYSSNVLCYGLVRTMTRPVWPVVVKFVQMYTGGSVPVLLIRSKCFTATCFGIYLTSSGGREYLIIYSSNVLCYGLVRIMTRPVWPVVECVQVHTGGSGTDPSLRSCKQLRNQ